MNKLFDLFKIASAIVTNQFPKLTNNKRRKLKILFLVRRYHTNMIPMVESLQKAGHQVAVIVRKREVIEDYDVLRPIEIQHPFNLEKCFSELPFLQPDLVLIRDTTVHMLEIASHAKNKGSKLIHYDQKPLRRLRGWRHFLSDLKRLRTKQIKGIPLEQITPVDHCDSISKRLPIKLMTRHFTFPYEAKTIGKYDNADSSTNKGIQVVMVGKMAQPRKRHFWLIRALKSANTSSCSLIICGAGNDIKTSDDGTRSQHYYDELIAAAKASENSADNCLIRLRQNLGIHEVKAVYENSDIFVLPSTNEEFGISVLEAMGGGCAVIATDTVGASHHIMHGRDGLIFKENDYPEFERQVHQLLEDATLRRSLQKEAKKTIQNNHNYTQFARFVENLLE